MMLRARMMVEQPDNIDMTLKLTMSIKEWCELRDQLNSGYPSWRLSSAITSMLVDARQVFYPPAEGKEIS